MRMGMGLGMSSALSALDSEQQLPQSQGWQLTVLDDKATKEEVLELDGELERLERVLGTEVGEWERRLGEINEELKGKK